MKKNETTQLSVGGRWGAVIVVLLFLALISFISAIVIGIFLSTSEIEATGNVAHIQIIGPIVAHADRGLFSSGVADSTEIVKLIKKADENEEVKAIMLEINSPGGTAVASYEIMDAVRKTNKTTVAWIREAGASGGYWVATGADHIIANPMSITGSIGVIASYIEWGGTLERYNASYRRLVSGDYKDMGSPFKEMTPEEEEIMTQNLDALRSFFVDDVAKNRHLSQEVVDEAADGRFYLGIQALDLGLIDELGGKEEAVAWIEDKEDIEAELAEYRKPKSLAEALTEVMSEHGFLMGLGIGQSMTAGAEKGMAIST